MARHVPRLAVSAQRFRARRLAHVLVCRDTSFDDEPLRAQNRSLVAGAVLAVILVAGCAILAVIRPQGVPDAAPILLARESGAMYVRVDGTVHPVLNLASARLISRTAAAPVVVAERALERLQRGPRLGIPGAPDAIGQPLDDATWTVCDTDRTLVAAGTPPPPLDPTRTVLATARGESATTTFLLYDGVRARVDLRERAVARALHLDGVVPVPVSRALLDTLPEVPAVTAPVITGAGASSVGGLPVGAVVRVARADADELHVVLADGLQRVGAVAAEVIRAAYRGTDDIPTIDPSAVAASPIVTILPVGEFPGSTRTPIGAADEVAVCVHWTPGETVVLSGDSQAVGASVGTALAQADGTGPRVDAVAVPAGRSVYVRSVGATGAASSDGPRFLVTDAGIVYGVPDDDAATALGLTEPAATAPWPILTQLPAGPELAIAAASVAWDVARA
jgi:type VII secretion protein EccB